MPSVGEPRPATRDREHAPPPEVRWIGAAREWENGRAIAPAPECTPLTARCGASADGRTLLFTFETASRYTHTHYVLTPRDRWRSRTEVVVAVDAARGVLGAPILGRFNDVALAADGSRVVTASGYFHEGGEFGRTELLFAEVATRDARTGARLAAFALEDAAPVRVALEDDRVRVWLKDVRERVVGSRLYALDGSAAGPLEPGTPPARFFDDAPPAVRVTGDAEAAPITLELGDRRVVLAERVVDGDPVVFFDAAGERVLFGTDEGARLADADGERILCGRPVGFDASGEPVCVDGDEILVGEEHRLTLPRSGGRVLAPALDAILVGEDRGTSGYSLSTGARIRRWEGRIPRAAFGESVVVERDRGAWILRGSEEVELAELEGPPPKAAASARFVGAATWNGPLLVFDRAGELAFRAVPEGFDGDATVWAIAIAASAARVAALWHGGPGMELVVYDAHDGRRLTHLPLGRDARDVALTPDGATAAVAYRGMAVARIDLG